MLKSRYDNRRAIVREHLSKIIHATPVTKQDPTALRSLWQGVDEQRRALTALGIQSHEMDIYTIHLVVDKLDTESRRQWELAHPGTGILTYLQLSEFLTTRCRALESAHSSKVDPTPQGSNFGQTSSRTQAQQTKRNQTYAAAQTFKSKCLKCNSGEHALYGCSSFKELDVESRRKFVQEGKLCFNCMRLWHISKDCPSQSRCRLCGKSHNTLLHVDNPPQSAYTRHEGSSTNQDPQVTSATCSDQILLQTAFVDVLDRQGRPIKCRALLDSGSQINLNTNSCRSKLGLKLEGSNAHYSVAGTAQMSSMGKSNVTLQIKDMQMKIPATVVKGKLTLPLTRSQV